MSQEFIMDNNIVNNVVDVILKESKLGELPGQDGIRTMVLNTVQRLYFNLFEGNHAICTKLEQPSTDAYGNAKPTRFSAKQDKLHANAFMQRDKMVELGINVIAKACRDDIDSRYPSGTKYSKKS